VPFLVPVQRHETREGTKDYEVRSAAPSVQTMRSLSGLCNIPGAQRFRLPIDRILRKSTARSKGVSCSDSASNDTPCKLPFLHREWRKQDRQRGVGLSPAPEVYGDHAKCGIYCISGSQDSPAKLPRSSSPADISLLSMAIAGCEFQFYFQSRGNVPSV
jgi:hypothetical protein